MNTISWNKKSRREIQECLISFGIIINMFFIVTFLLSLTMTSFKLYNFMAIILEIGWVSSVVYVFILFKFPVFTYWLIKNNKKRS